MMGSLGQHLTGQVQLAYEPSGVGCAARLSRGGRVNTVIFRLLGDMPTKSMNVRLPGQTGGRLVRSFFRL